MLNPGFHPIDPAISTKKHFKSPEKEGETGNLTSQQNIFYGAKNLSHSRAYAFSKVGIGLLKGGAKGIEYLGRGLLVTLGSAAIIGAQISGLAIAIPIAVGTAGLAFALGTVGAVVGAFGGLLVSAAKRKFSDIEGRLYMKEGAQHGLKGGAFLGGVPGTIALAGLLPSIVGALFGFGCISLGIGKEKAIKLYSQLTHQSTRDTASSLDNSDDEDVVAPSLPSGQNNFEPSVMELPTSYLTQDYLNLQQEAYNYLKEKFPTITWTTTFNGGIDGSIKSLESIKELNDKLIRLEINFGRSKKTSISNLQQIIKIANLSRKEKNQSSVNPSLFTFEFIEQVEIVKNYLKTIKLSGNREFGHFSITTEEGKLRFTSTQGTPLTGDHEAIAAQEEERIKKETGITAKLNLRFSHRGKGSSNEEYGTFSGEIDPEEIQKIVEIANRK